MTINPIDPSLGEIPNNVLDFLEATARYIETHPWGRGGMNPKRPIGSRGNCPCLLESAAIVGGRHPIFYGAWYDSPLARVNPLFTPTGIVEREAIDALAAESAASYGTTAMGVNDATRDKRKVVRFVRRTARKLAAELSEQVAA